MKRFLLVNYLFSLLKPLPLQFLKLQSNDSNRQDGRKGPFPVPAGSVYIYTLLYV